MLAATPELRQVGEASSGAEALRAIEKFRPDLVLMDVHMLDMDGPTTAKSVLFPYTSLMLLG